MSEPNLHRKWRFQFSLRTILVLMVGIAIGFPIGRAQIKFGDWFRPRTPPAVLVHMQVVELQHGELEKLRIEWAESSSALRYASVSEQSMTATFKSLEQQNRATMLTRPTLMSTSGQPAYVSTQTGRFEV